MCRNSVPKIRINQSRGQLTDTGGNPKTEKPHPSRPCETTNNIKRDKRHQASNKDGVSAILFNKIVCLVNCGLANQSCHPFDTEIASNIEAECRTDHRAAPRQERSTPETKKGAVRESNQERGQRRNYALKDHENR